MLSNSREDSWALAGRCHNTDINVNGTIFSTWMKIEFPFSCSFGQMPRRFLLNMNVMLGLGAASN